MLHVDEGGFAPGLLGLGHHVEGHGGFAGGFRAVDLYDPTSGDAANAQGHIQAEGAGGDGVNLHGGGLPQLHDSALAELLFDLLDGAVQGFFLFGSVHHLFYLGLTLGFLLCHSSFSVSK